MKSQSPESKVSVVIPTHNRAPMLGEAIESVLAQSCRDFELIVVDDGSTDETPELLETFHGRLRALRQANGGVASARNRGIAESKGEWLAFLDSDDLWHEGKLAAQMNLVACECEARVCYTDEVWIRRGVRVNPKKVHAKHSGWIFEACLPLCTVSPSSVLIHRSVFDDVGLFDESLPVCEDYDLWIRIAHRYPIYLVPQRLITKRGGHRDQLSNRSWGNDRYRVVALEKALGFGGLDDSRRAAVLRQLVRKCRLLAQGFAKRGKEAEAETYGEKAVEYGEMLHSVSGGAHADST